MGNKILDNWKEMMIYAKYCPFTGKPLYDDLEDGQ